jgi:topoisomerase-4 subunit A
MHLDGKSKNYMVKRFAFENCVIGKQVSIISEEAGSKLILIGLRHSQWLAVVQLKGKAQTPKQPS